MIQTLHHSDDAYGSITVLDDGECRILTFAPNDEQSRCLKSAPHILQYEYTQAMLLVLLFCQPKRVLVLGLGGGSLVTALHRHIPGIHITAVELRATVIEVAQRFFQMPRSKRLQIVQQDADDFLNNVELRKVDAIFADLYHGDGVDHVQLRADFVARCAANLKEDGWLVMNCWTEQREDPVLRDALRAHFTDIRTVLTASRNWVIIAGKAPDLQTTRALKDTAEHLSASLGFPLIRALMRSRALGE
ncbi:MAG: spermidine synthase [Thiothrix lacustris]|uniref:Spermidine synthase n=1 Tax=Thiothrix lacustris TaxID=525917 RepID=A0A1Y1QUS0_9GAMM|nr:MAG: spermidine synthase [Thiothrix lacustris]